MDRSGFSSKCKTKFEYNIIKGEEQFETICHTGRVSPRENFKPWYTDDIYFITP